MKRIIIVEDDKCLRLLLEKILQKHNFNTISFTEGKSAYNFLIKNQNESFLVLSDIDMPHGWSGLELFKQYHNSNLNNGTFIVMSAYNPNQNKIQKLNYNFIKRYFSKPYKPKQIIEYIKNTLS